MRPSQIPLFTLLAILLAACGSGSILGAGGDDTVELAGTYWSVSVTENGEPRALVDGTRIQLSFDDNRLGASAGCNSMGGTFSLNDGVLEMSEMDMTAMGCDGPRHEQDEFVSRFLGDSPVVLVEGDSLTLSTDTVSMELLDREVADPGQTLFDTKWTFDTFFDLSVAQSVAIDKPGWMQFTDESSATGFDGCVEFTLSVEVSDGSTGGPIPDGADGELQFGTRADTTTATCDEQTASYANLIDRALRGQATYEIDGQALTITAPNGNGVILRSDR